MSLVVPLVAVTFIAVVFVVVATLVVVLLRRGGPAGTVRTVTWRSGPSVDHVLAWARDSGWSALREPPPWLAGLTASPVRGRRLFRDVVSGVVDGRDVVSFTVVEPSGDDSGPSRPRERHVVVLRRAGHAPGLVEILPDGLWSTLAGPFAGRDVEVGHPVLDAQSYVRGSALDARALLAGGLADALATPEHSTSCYAFERDLVLTWTVGQTRTDRVVPAARRLGHLADLADAALGGVHDAPVDEVQDGPSWGTPSG